MELKERYQAYRTGYLSGSLDRSLACTSRYASTSFPTESEFLRLYSQGYRDGNKGLTPRFSEILS